MQQKTEVELESTSDKVNMFTTSRLSYILAAICLALSIVFNTELIRPFGADPDSTILKVFEYGARGLLVVGFFLFALISWGNLKELRGSFIGAKEIVILVVLSLLQTVRNGYVFLTACVGVTVVFLYIWLMQEKIR